MKDWFVLKIWFLPIVWESRNRKKYKLATRLTLSLKKEEEEKRKKHTNANEKNEAKLLRYNILSAIKIFSRTLSNLKHNFLI